MEGEEKRTEGAGALRLKIAKKAYVFDVKRKYSPTRTFSVKKKAETPLDEFKQDIASMMRKKEGHEGEKKQPAEKKPGGIPLPLLVAGGIILLFFLAIAFIVITIGGTPLGSSTGAPPGVFNGDYKFSIEQMRVLSVGSIDKPGREGYFLVSYNTKNISALNFSATLYKNKPPSQVFVLDYARENADTYPQFITLLKEKLSARGIAVGEIGLEALPSLPEGATLLVPTGYFPKEMMKGNGDYRALLLRGVNIIYIGMPFDTLALDRSGSAVPASEKYVIFSKSRPESSEGFTLFDAQYAVQGTGQQAGSTAGAVGSLYGSVSTLSLGGGIMFFLPQFLDMGWPSDMKSQSYEKAATDVARLIEEERWIEQLSGASAVANLEGSGKGISSMYTGQYDSDFAYVKFVADAADSQGIKRRTIDIFRLRKEQNGEILPRDPVSVPYYLSGQKTRLGMSLHEEDSTPVKLYLSMQKDGNELQKSDLEAGLTNPTIERSVDFQINSEPGEYNLLVADANDRIYAATRLSVAGMDIAVNRTLWGAGNFMFFLSSAGKPVTPHTLSVTFDGKGQQDYTPADMKIDNGRTVVDYSYRGTIDAGMHTFAFAIGDFSAVSRQEYVTRKFFWDNPLVVGLGLLSVLVFGVGVLLRRVEAPKYGLDIPDFPPLSMIKIPMKRGTVLQLFDDVNLRYSWKWMPLRVPEIKNGFGKLTYNGKPILVGDFNLERLLVKLKDEGLVKNELDYWGLARWEEESRHSIHYLTVYRIMRNIFVNNAVKFSKIDSMPDCDVKALVGKDEMYIHIMEEPYERVIHRALATTGKGLTVIVFKTEEEMDRLTSSLTSTSRLAVGLKLEVNNKNIILLPVKNSFAAYLKQKIV